MLGLAARLQRSVINDNISAARERLESSGRSWGRPSRFTSAEVEKIVALKEQGMSIRKIAVKVRVPHSSVALALKRAAVA